MFKSVHVYHSDNGFAVKRIGGGASKLSQSECDIHFAFLTNQIKVSA